MPDQFYFCLTYFILQTALHIFHIHVQTMCLGCRKSYFILPVLGPVYMEKNCPGQEGRPPSRVNLSEGLYQKRGDPLCPIQELAFQRQQCSSMLWSSRLDRVDPAGQGKVFIWRKVGPARKVTLPSKGGDLTRQVTPLAESTFCFSCKQFVKFCKEI